MIRDHLDGLDGTRHALLIVGSGPVGLTPAMQLARELAG